MDTDRSAAIAIGGIEYELVLTTRATREIAKRYGGLESLGETLMRSENAEIALAEIVWIVCLLANQAIQIHNLKNPENKRELITEEEVDLLTTPAELTEYKDAIVEAMSRGTRRDVEGKGTGKTRRPGKRRRDVYPALLLRHGADEDGARAVLAYAARAFLWICGSATSSSSAWQSRRGRCSSTR